MRLNVRALLPWRGVAAIALAGAASLDTAGARADEVSGTRSPEELVETSHLIELHLDRGHADLIVRRTVYNGGPRHDQAVFMLDIPQGAVATGLATLGAREGRPFWFRGDLMEAEAAAAKYMELTGIGGYHPKDPALLSWRTPTRLALQVFPCPPGQPKTVEYTLRMPTTYRDGRHHLLLPRLGTEAVAPRVIVSSAHPSDRLFVDGNAIPAGTSFRLTRDETDVALAPRPGATLDGALASVAFAEARSLVALRIDAPARLSEPPRRARVVVILDASRSLAARDGAAGIAAAKAYLAHLGGSFAEVLTFARDVEPRHGRFVASARAAADLDKLALPRRNGSRIDDALARADAMLATAPKGAPRRILALTDLRTRATLTPERLGAIVKSGALVHIGVIGEGAPALSRDDDHAWAAPVRATGGLVWSASASADPRDASAMARVYEEWVRPMRIDHLAVRAADIDPVDLGFGEALAEGEGLEHHRVHTSPVPEVVLTGELWATPLRRSFRASRAHDQLWSALVFGSDLLGELSEPEMAVLARRGGAVSPVTSYLAIEPGVRPSTEGLDWTGSGEGGGGRGDGIGLGNVGTIGRGGGFDHRAFLRGALAQAFGRCPAGPSAARMDVETTIDEVVDVPRISLVGRDDPSVRRCLEEAAWALALPAEFRDEWARYDVELSR